MEYLTLIKDFVLASGVVGTLVFYTSKRRKANAEASDAEITAQGRLIDQYEKFIDTLTQENKDLKEELQGARTEAREARKQEATERDRVVTAYKERSDALVELEILRGKHTLSEWNKCEVVTCLLRTPPRS